MNYLFRRCYHWVVVISFSTICVATPRDSIGQIENRLRHVESQAQRHDTILHDYVRNNGHPVVVARIAALETSNATLIISNTALNTIVTEWGGIFKGVLALVGVVQTLVVAIGVLVYKRIKDIDEILRKMRTQEAK